MYEWVQAPYVYHPFFDGYPVYNMQSGSPQAIKSRTGYRQVQPQSYDASGYRQVLTHQQQSLYALEVQCSFATQMKLTAETKNLPGLPELHRHNYESSYHRTTSIGCLHRILSGERHPHVFGIMIRCMIESEEHDIASQRAIQQMQQHATGSAATWVDTVRRWHALQLSQLQQAMRITRGLVGDQMWQYAKGLEY